MSLLDINPTKFPSFSGSIALITGGSSGIGLATAELLSSLSCLVIVADLSPPPASAAGGTLHFHKTDVASYSSLLSAFDKSFTTFGAYPDIVFANAGIGERGDLFGGVTDENVREEPKHEVLNIDSEAVANTVRIGWWGMKKRGGGNIILTASMAGYMGQPGLGMYNAAKHSVVGLMRGLRYIGPKDNIAISLIAPAITSTPLISSSATSFEAVAQNLVEQGVPMNTPERIAEAVVWMAAQKIKANGMGLCVQNNECIDIEKNIAATRSTWMGQRMANLYKGGTGSNPFEKMAGRMGLGDSKL